ncbi:MAG: hypothetical protein HY784_02835 [Chloroflexi bacterium]|nr:hypothetical protein [Chloroflexota bacterium]
MAMPDQPAFIGDRRARAAVQLLRRLTPPELQQVVALMPELRRLSAETDRRQSAADYWRRVLNEERGGYHPSLNDQFLIGLTYREYFALSETEQDDFWERMFAEEVWEIEDFEDVNVALLVKAAFAG